MSQRTACLGGQAHGGLDKLAVPAGHTAAGEDRGVLPGQCACLPPFRQALIDTGTPEMNKRGRETRPRCQLNCWGTRTRT